MRSSGFLSPRSVIWALDSRAKEKKTSYMILLLMGIIHRIARRYYSLTETLLGGIPLDLPKYARTISELSLSMKAKIQKRGTKKSTQQHNNAVSGGEKIRSNSADKTEIIHKCMQADLETLHTYLHLYMVMRNSKEVCLRLSKD